MADDKPLKKTIDKLLRAYGYQDQLDEIELIKVYERLVGKLYKNHTQQITIKNKTLFIYLNSAPLKQELSYIKEGLTQKLNKEMGRKVIEKIVIR